MLTEKEYLVLCDSVSKNDSLDEIIACSGLLQLELKDSMVLEKVKLYTFEEKSGETCIVFAQRVHSNSPIKLEDQRRLIDYVKNNRGTPRCTLTGLQGAGRYVAYAASKLNLEGVLFGAPTTEKLPASVRNLVGENDPVGQFIDNVIFVKQKPFDVNTKGSYLETLLFDDQGRALISEQTEYSKFCSWFYSKARDINGGVWRIFFKDSSANDSLLNKDLYCVFLEVNKLTMEGLQDSLERTLRFIEHELDNNRKQMRAEFRQDFQGLDVANLHGLICKIVKQVTKSAVAIVGDTFGSVETILMGAGLFSLGKSCLNTNALMTRFSVDAEAILEREKLRINEFTKEEIRRVMEVSMT